MAAAKLNAAGLSPSATIMLEIAEKYLGFARSVLERDEEVLPVVVTLNAAGKMAVYGLAGKSDAVHRRMFVRHVVQQDGAQAVMLFSDAYMRAIDPPYEIVGEGLQAFIETAIGERVTVVQRYTRDPLRFAAPEQGPGEATHGEVFPNPRQTYH